MPPARKPTPPDPEPLKTLIASAHPEGWVPRPIEEYDVPEEADVTLLNLEEESRLARIRARVHNGHAEHTDARFLLEILDRYMA